MGQHWRQRPSRRATTTNYPKTWCSTHTYEILARSPSLLSPFQPQGQPTHAVIVPLPRRVRTLSSVRYSPYITPPFGHNGGFRANRWISQAKLFQGGQGETAISDEIKTPRFFRPTRPRLCSGQCAPSYVLTSSALLSMGVEGRPRGVA